MIKVLISIITSSYKNKWNNQIVTKRYMVNEIPVYLFTNYIILLEPFHNQTKLSKFKENNVIKILLYIFRTILGF